MAATRGNSPPADSTGSGGIRAGILGCQEPRVYRRLLVQIWRNTFPRLQCKFSARVRTVHCDHFRGVARLLLSFDTAYSGKRQDLYLDGLSRRSIDTVAQ